MSQASPVRPHAGPGDAPRLAHVIDVDAHEGPVYVESEHALYFTTLPKPGPLVDIKRLALDSLSMSLVRADADAANGMALDHDGRLVVCEQRRGALARVDRRTGARETVVAGFNSPNDVVVKSDGTLWFTDPSYGHLQGFRPEPQRPDAVYRFDPLTSELTTLTDSLDKPNGLCFSPGETTLYVADSGAPRQVKAFDVVDGRALAGERVLFVTERGFPDGLKVDAAGRVYSSSADGVQVHSPAGAPLDAISLPGAVNFCFGRPERDVLFITADTAIHAAHLYAKGA